MLIILDTFVDSLFTFKFGFDLTGILSLFLSGYGVYLLKDWHDYNKLKNQIDLITPKIKQLEKDLDKLQFGLKGYFSCSLDYNPHIKLDASEGIVSIRKEGSATIHSLTSHNNLFPFGEIPSEGVEKGDVFYAARGIMNCYEELSFMKQKKLISDAGLEVGAHTIINSIESSRYIFYVMVYMQDEEFKKQDLQRFMSLYSFFNDLVLLLPVEQRISYSVKLFAR